MQFIQGQNRGQMVLISDCLDSFIGTDNETRMKLLPKEQEIIKEWEDNGTLLASYIKADAAEIYLVLMANDKSDVDMRLSNLPYYPYMKIEIMTLR